MYACERYCNDSTFLNIRPRRPQMEGTAAPTVHLLEAEKVVWNAYQDWFC